MSDYLDILSKKRDKWMNSPTLMTNQTPPEAPCRISGRVLGHVRSSYLAVIASITSHFYKGIRQCVAGYRKEFWLLVHVLFKSREDLNVSGRLSGNLHDIFMIYYCCLVTKGSPTLCDPMDCSMPGLLVHHQLLEFTQTHVYCVGDAIQPSHSLLSPFSSCSQYFPASESSNESTLRIRWPKYWNFNFSISPSNEYSELIFFRIDWFDLLAIQGTLKTLLQHHSLKA